MERSNSCHGEVLQIFDVNVSKNVSISADSIFRVVFVLSCCAFLDVRPLTPLRISPQQSEKIKEREGDDLERGSKLPAGDFGKETLS